MAHEVLRKYVGDILFFVIWTISSLTVRGWIYLHGYALEVPLLIRFFAVLSLATYLWPIIKSFRAKLHTNCAIGFLAILTGLCQFLAPTGMSLQAMSKATFLSIPLVMLCYLRVKVPGWHVPLSAAVFLLMATWCVRPTHDSVTDNLISGAIVVALVPPLVFALRWTGRDPEPQV